MAVSFTANVSVVRFWHTLCKSVMCDMNYGVTNHIELNNKLKYKEREIKLWERLLVST